MWGGEGGEGGVSSRSLRKIEAEKGVDPELLGEGARLLQER
jgi:hypothetical protein